MVDIEEKRVARERIERGAVVAGHPCLRAETANFAEQRRPAVDVEMRRHLVEQQDRRGTFLALG